MGIYHLVNIFIRELIRTPRVGCIISDIRQSGYSFLYKNSVRSTFGQKPYAFASGVINIL
jgi:hypothetical protein